MTNRRPVLNCVVGIFAAALLFAVPSAATAQPSDDAVSLAEDYRALRREAADVAQTEARAGNDDRVEAALACMVRPDAGTPAWHLAMGNELTRLAFRLQREGEPAACDRLARRAMRCFDEAIRSSTDASLRANARQSAALLCERVFADPENARRFYRAALQDAPRASQAAERLAALDAAADAQAAGGNR